MPLITAIRPHLQSKIDRPVARRLAGSWLLLAVLSAAPVAAQTPSRPVTVRAQVVAASPSQRALSVGRALMTGAGRRGSARIEVGVATVQVVPEKRPVLSIQFLRN